MAAANASLKSPNLIAERRKIMGDNRIDTLDFLTKHNVEFVPSESNCFMMNVKRPGKEFYDAMAKQHVYIGRVWPAWPQWVRVSVGSKDEMAKFKEAFVKVYNA
jgi:histidinol-phosphate/aromatic aminotransferase/cobyric acid decarboxylase-like protein